MESQPPAAAGRPQPQSPQAPPSQAPQSIWSPPPTGSGAPGQPGYTWPRPPGTARPKIPREPRLPVRATADRRVVIGIIAGGAGFDIAGRGGLAAISMTAWIIAVAATILISGRVKGRTGRLCIGAAAALAVLLTIRTSPWVTIPVVVAVAGLLLLGVAVGADGAGPVATFPGLWARAGVAAGHMALAPGILGRSGKPAGATADGKAPAVTATLAVLAGLPVLLVVAVLLAAADPIFRSWFSPAAIPRHLILVAAGAWIVAGLARAASASRPAPGLPSAPAVGVPAIAFVLAGLCALYAAFASAQLVALSGAGHRILVTHGLTYAKYARSGFFELLACAAITLLVLLGAWTFASRASKILKSLAALTVALTIVVVVVAIRRLELYEAAYGLTMLRLACLAVAVWIGVLFVVLGSTLLRRGLPSRAFPAAFIASGLLLITAWGVANPASIVATTNLRRAGQGHAFDIREVTGLGADAVPAIEAGLRYLDPAQVATLRSLICGGPPRDIAGVSFNLSAAQASHALARTCGLTG